MIYREAEARERFPHGAWDASWRKRKPPLFRAVPLDLTEGPNMNLRPGRDHADYYLDLPTVLSRLTYEERECGFCRGHGEIAQVRRGSFRKVRCPKCHGTGKAPPPPEVVKFAERLGLDCASD